MFEAMPRSVWVLSAHQHKVTRIARSIIWDSSAHAIYHDVVGAQYEPFVEYDGPQGRMYHQLDRHTWNTILTFVVDEIVEFGWKCFVPPLVVQSTQYTGVEQLKGVVLNNLYINT